jgi:hypothetical protein
MQDANTHSLEAASAVAELVRHIDAWPAELRSFEYQYEVFGCWQIVIRHKGARTRFSYDGKDGYLHAERLQKDAGDFTKPPKSLGGMDANASLDAQNLERVLQFMREHAG